MQDHTLNHFRKNRVPLIPEWVELRDLLVFAIKNGRRIHSVNPKQVQRKSSTALPGT